LGVTAKTFLPFDFKISSTAAIKLFLISGCKIAITQIKSATNN
jgi:hypothetical protein